MGIKKIFKKIIYFDDLSGDFMFQNGFFKNLGIVSIALGLSTMIKEVAKLSDFMYLNITFIIYLITSFFSYREREGINKKLDYGFIVAVISMTVFYICLLLFFF